MNISAHTLNMALDKNLGLVESKISLGKVPPKKTVLFRTFFLNCGWVGVKSPKLFSETNNVLFI